MNQYGHQRDQMNQNPLFWKHSQNNNYNKEIYNNQENYEIELKNQQREQYQLDEDYGNNQIEINQGLDLNQYTQKYDQQINQEDTNYMHQNMLEDLSDEYCSQQEYQQHQQSNNFPDINYGSQLCDKIQKQINQHLNHDYVNLKKQDQGVKVEFQNFMSSGTNSFPIGNATEYENKIYLEQNNINQQQNQMNLVAKLNTNVTKRQSSTHANTPSLLSWCENNTLNNLNGFTGNNGAITNFQASQLQNMKQAYLQEENQKNNILQQQQSSNTFKKQQFQSDEDNFGRENFEQYAQNNSSQLSCGNIPTSRLMEGNEIYSGQLSQRNAPKSNPFTESTSQFQKKIIQKQLASHQGNVKVSSQQIQKNFKQGEKQFQNEQIPKQKCNSHNLMNYDDTFCIFCQNSDRFFYDSSQIVSRLYLKYASSQNYYYTRDLNEILNNYRSKAAIHYKDTAMLDEEAEYLKRYYHYTEYPKKSKLLTEYYKFHKDIPRLFMLPETYILNSFHDKKRRFDYYRIAQLIEEENQRNPNRPPKGIVGEKPPLRTNESSEDGKNENGKVEKESEKNGMLLGEISSFINRGQGRQDDNEFHTEEDGLDFNEETQFTDRFIQCINIQIQNGQGNGNSIAAVSTTSLNSLGKKELINQKINHDGVKAQQMQLNLIQQQQNSQNRQLNQQQKSQYQLPTSNSQLQQYEISANAFLNYQKKLEQYKNTKRNTNNQNNNAKLSVGSKQQSINSQPSQQIQEKQKKKTTQRTDASLTIQELNMKLEEIVTSHSLISNSRILNGCDDELRQFDYRELDEFLKFLNKKEKDNLNSMSATSTQLQQLNQQNIQVQKLNQKEILNYADPKDMYLAKNNQVVQKKSNSQNSQHQQQQQNSSSKGNSKNNQQLQQLQQQQHQNINYQFFQNDKQYQQNINSQLYQNDTSRYNNATSSNTSSNQQQLLPHNQNQSNLIQQQQQSITKKVKAKPSKSDILCSDQFRSNPSSHNDIQTPQLNDMNIEHYINQQNLSPSASIQQMQPILSNQNYLNKNQNPQSSTSQSKKRLTPQLRLDDIEYFNDNKMISGKQQQQQLTGSLSVKFSHRDTLNFQQNQSSVRSARDQYPTTSTSKANMKGSCDNKLVGGLFQQSNQTIQNSGTKQQIQINQSNNPQNLNIKDQILGLSNNKQQFNQNLNQDQFLATNVTKNNFINSATSNSFGLKLDTKESQLFTPRQPQIQPTTATSSNQKNLFSKCHQILLSKPPLSPRESLPSPKNITNNNLQGQNENPNNSASKNNQNLDQVNYNQANSITPETQNDLRFCQKNNNLKKKQKSQQLQSQQFSQQGNNSTNNQTGNNNSLTSNNILNNQNQISNSTVNLQSQSIHANQQSTKKGNLKHLSLKLKLDQLNFSKEKANFNNIENISNNQIIKEPLSQRSCSSKNLDQQTPKYNLYEMFKQQISNQAYSQMMLKPEMQLIKPQTQKNSESSTCQTSVFNMINLINQQQIQQKATPSREIPQTINNLKLDTNKNSAVPSVTFQDQNDHLFSSQKQQKQLSSQLCQSQNQNMFLQQNSQQLMISSPQPTKSQSINPQQLSPTYTNSNTKLMVNVNSSQLNQNQQPLSSSLSNYQVAFINGLQQNSCNISNNGVTRTTANSTNRKSAAFIHINNSGNNLQSAKNQLEQQKKVISQQTTRSEANTRKNSQIKQTFEKSQHSTAAAGLPSGVNLNSKHVSRNSSLEMNNNQNVLRKKSPQLFKYQQKDTKNVYNLVQQLSNNFSQSTPKQTVSARNYQTQRSSINHFDFQKPELTQYASQNQHSQIQQSALIQSLSYNNQLNNNFLQQGQQSNKQNQQMSDSETLVIESNANPASFNNSASKNMKNQHNTASSNLHNNNNINNYPVMIQTPQCQILPQSVVQNHLNSNSKGINYLQQNSQNLIVSSSQQNFPGQIKISQSNTATQNQQQQQQIQSHTTQQQAQQNKISSPQMTKKVTNMHKHTKSENLMNLMIETNIQNCMNQPQVIQTPCNQVGISNIPATQISSNSTNKKNQKMQQTGGMINNIISSNSINYQNQIQHPSILSQHSVSSTTQMSPRIILNQNLQVSQSDKQNYCSVTNQLANNNNGYGQLLNKKQSLASPLSSRSTQMNFQVELFRSTNNSTNNNNSNTNNTISQHNNNPNSGVYNNSSSMNSQFNNNNINNNSNNSTAQQINSSLNTNNIGSNNANVNTFNQINYAGLSVSSNSSNLLQNNNINNNINNNTQKKNNIVSNQMNGFFNIQQQNIKQNSTSSTGATCSSNTNIISNNLLRTTHDNSLQSNMNKKSKKKSMF